jgi:hypothetical protein
MTTAVGRQTILAGLVLTALSVVTPPRDARAIPLDDRGEMKLGMRAYTALRIGTQKIGDDDNPLNWPASGAGHVRQNRYFLQLDFDHDLTRLAQSGWGFARLFGLLDQGFDALGWQGKTDVRYSVQYRGEGEAIYGGPFPDEYSDPGGPLRAFRRNVPNVSLPPLVNLSRELPEEYIRERVDRLRRIARQRHRLFLAYLDWERGPLFIRVGEQVLAWGETDVFRLLDNINPLDDSFGGFFIALDERRLPLEMVRSSYRFGDLGPLQDAFLEGFAATGHSVATFPGIPNGSPWSPGGIAYPNDSVRATWNIPDATDVRGGARFVFTYGDTTTTLAHYWTYLDIPGVRFRLPGAVQCAGEAAPSNTARFCNPILAKQEFPRVPITGLSTTFPVPSWYAIIRSEIAYFTNEPMNRQGGHDANTANDCLQPKGTAARRRCAAFNNLEGGLNPFVMPGFLDIARTQPVYAKLLQRDSFNMAIGADVNRFVRWINPQQTLFFTTQLFYKHVFDAPDDLVLPVPFRNTRVGNLTPVVGTKGLLPRGCGVGGGRRRPCPLQPRLFHLNNDRFLQTLLITTSYSGGRIVPSVGMFYDWQGTMVFQPAVQLVRDPFRFIVDYTRVAGPPTGQFGAVRDRDNVRFQVEFVY